jgi:ABC-type multidrug transport system fused ATPase/permease subunit
MLAILSNDAELISGFVTNTLVQLLPLGLTFAGAFVMMALIDPLIATLALLLVPAYYLATKIIGRRIRPISRAWIDAYSSLFTFLEENLGMLPAIKAFTREREEARRFELHNASLLSLSRRQLLVQALLGPTVALMAGLGLLLLLWLGSARITAGELAPAQLVSLLLYAMLLSQPVRGLADIYGQLQRTRGAAERIVEFLGEQPEPDDTGRATLPPVKGDIRFEGVYFHYPNGNPVLQGLDLHIAAGETVAITGPNGVGKSTIAHLLMRLADADAGRILIDGADIAGVALASLRAQIGLVAQHTLLVNGTVAENIGYGRPRVGQVEIEAAAHKAHAHGFISRLPNGYDTVIGDQGLRLSGGQRQRISLARTLLIDPPILILDEATSMFDPAGEKSFIAECRDILEGKTVLLITHRPASLGLADRVIHLSPPATGARGQPKEKFA